MPLAVIYDRGAKVVVRSNNMPMIDLTLQHGQTLEEAHRRLEITVNEVNN